MSQIIETNKNQITMSENEMIHQYSQILESLQSDEIKDLDRRLQVVTLGERFPEFAKQCRAWFSLAFSRSPPYTVNSLIIFLNATRREKSGEITNDQARHEIMTEALRIRDFTDKTDP